MYIFFFSSFYTRGMLNRAGASALQVLVTISYLYITNVGKHMLNKPRVLVVYFKFKMYVDVLLILVMHAQI